MAAYNFLIAYLFVFRKDPQKQGQVWEFALGLLGTAVPFLAFRPHEMGQALTVLGAVVKVLGLVGLLWSVYSLGKSIGIGPADRGLIQHGPYRYIRHPMYSFQILFSLGYCLANPSLLNFAGLAALCAIQYGRATREERIVSSYTGYKASVPWRFFPGVL